MLPQNGLKEDGKKLRTNTPCFMKINEEKIKEEQ